jgi:hypothetical protein
MRRATALAAVGLVAAVLAGCGGSKDSDTYVLDLQGAAQVTAPGPVRHLAAGRHRLAVGQTVTITEGRGVLGLPGDTSLELRHGRLDSTVRVGPRPTLVEGDALAVAASGDDLTIGAGGATVALRDGAARLRRSAGVTLAVYQGEAAVRSLGRRLVAPALRQVSVTDSGSLPHDPAPLVYDRTDPDPWDTRYLNDAIDLGGQLERRVRLLNTRPAPTAWDGAYLEGIVPALRSAKGFRDDLVAADRSVGETVVGASIALGGAGDLARRWSSAFSFRDAGADWGLVALDQRARRASVLGVLDGVLDRVVTPISSVAGGRSGGSAGPVDAGRAPVTTTTTTTAPPRRGTTPVTVPLVPATPLLPPITLPLLPSPTPTTPAPTTPTQPTSPTPTIPPVPLLAPVQGLLDGLLGGGGGGTGTGSGSGSSGGGSGGGLLGGLVGGLLGGS